MLCSDCKKTQATRLVRREGERELYLCDDCFLRLCSAGGEFTVSVLQPQQEAPERCPVCGTTLEDYARTGLLGCAACYDVFREQMEPVILRIQGSTAHEGKSPLSDERQLRLLDEQRALRGELERALREKRMKEADSINRALRRLNRSIYGDGGLDD